MRTLLVSFLLIFLSLPVFASEADDLYSEGTTAYLAGDFPKAIRAFKAAAKLDDDPIIRLNMSLCYEALENHSKALQYAYEAQKGGLAEDVQDKNAGRIAAFKLILHTESALSSMASLNAGESLCITAKDCEDGLICGNSGLCELNPNVKYEEERLGSVGYVGAAVLTVGAGLIVYTIAGPDAKVAENEAKLPSTPNGPEKEKLRQTIEDDRSTGLILLFSGVGIAAVGAGLLLYDLATVKQVPVAVTPILDINTVGANFSVKF